MTVTIQPRQGSIPAAVPGWDCYLVSKLCARRYRIVAYDPATRRALLQGQITQFETILSAEVLCAYKVEIKKAQESKKRRNRLRLQKV